MIFDNSIDAIVKNEIYRREVILIQKQQFLKNNQPIFITNLEIQNTTGLSENDVVLAINNLDSKEFMIYNNLFGMSSDPNVKFLIRSRIYHIIWCLYKSTNRTRNRGIQFNVGDYQYLRHIKYRPKLSKNLEEIFNDEEIKKILNYPKNNLISKIISHITSKSDFTKMSNFQTNSTTSILKNLEKRNSPSGLVIVAGTGAGKSFAYQFPLLLWILNKKIRLYDEYRKNNIKIEELHVNCSGLLIFPRNALAEDQLESISYLIDLFNEEIENFPDALGKKFLKIKKPVPDFHSKISSKLKKKYGDDIDGYPDIIITHPKSLERRILNPECSPVYRNGIDCILYDEVHLWDGIEGAKISSLNARLQNLIQQKSRPPLFVGMSATIDQPDWHCQKLFSLIKQKRPELISQNDNDDTEKFSIEHHLILKPRSGRPPIGVAIDTTSCLIHNRRDGLSSGHDDFNNPSRIDRESKPKSLTFIDSLNQTGSFTNKLNNFEYFWYGRAQKARDGNSQKPHRSYLYHYRPEMHTSSNLDCTQCIAHTNSDIFRCPSYLRGECWYYSLDDGNQHANVPYGNWHPFVPGDRLTVPRDNIRSKRVTSLEDKKMSSDKYDYFLYNDSIWIPDGLRPANVGLYSDIDNVVATSTLEVGVDFKNIKEVIQFGEIRSPSSYKQKAGRGAREGNSEDGLFAMSIITDSPLSYYHFKHFTRLVKSSLDPLKLEITNPDIIKSNCYSSIFDFIAFNKINLFKISNLNSKETDIEYEKTLKLLSSEKLKKFLLNFINQSDVLEPNFINTIIFEATNFLKILFTKTTIKINSKDEEHSLHEWLIKSVDSTHILQQVQSKFGIDIMQRQQEQLGKIDQKIDELQIAFKKYFPDDDLLNQKLNELRGKLYA
jgi:hypothetical protein